MPEIPNAFDNVDPNASATAAILTVPLGGAASQVGKLNTVSKSLGANPFKGLKGGQVADKLTAKGFRPMPDAASARAGNGTFISPSGRAFHIDAAHPAPKKGHM